MTTVSFVCVSGRCMIKRVGQHRPTIGGGMFLLFMSSVVEYLLQYFNIFHNIVVDYLLKYPNIIRSKSLIYDCNWSIILVFCVSNISGVTFGKMLIYVINFQVSFIIDMLYVTVLLLLVYYYCYCYYYYYYLFYFSLLNMEVSNNTIC